MSAIPATFNAFVAERSRAAVNRGVRSFVEANLPPGDVEIRVLWSGVNYKDGLATIADGKVARISPLIPGIDLAGEVVASADPAIPAGMEVLVHGYDLGASRHGGFAEYQRVPAGWVVPLPAGLTPRLAMALGTAGFTAALSVFRLEDRGLRPGQRAGAGHGRVRRAGIGRGRDPRRPRLRGRCGDREAGPGGPPARPGRGDGHRPGRGHGGELATPRGRTLGGRGGLRGRLRRSPSSSEPSGATRPSRRPETPVGRTSRRRSSPSSCAGAALIGIDSVPVAIAERRAIWQRLGDDLRPNGLGDGVTEVTLDTLDDALDGVLAGRARGRWLVRIGE